MKKNYIVYLSIVVIILSVIIYYINSYNNKSTEPIIESKLISEDSNDINTSNKVYVEIKGAVNNPGVYEMDSNSRVIDVVRAAGDFKEDANTRYINLSKKIKDEMNIIIYTNEEINNLKEKDVVLVEKECVCPVIKNDACIEDNNTKEQKKDNSSLISINSASIEELLNIPGIGESKAKSIVEYRNEKKFETIDDIKNVKGIGESLFEKIKEYITV